MLGHSDRTGTLRILLGAVLIVALVVFLFAIAGVSLGRWLIDRKLEKQPRRHHGLAEARSGVAVSALHFYEKKGLISSRRTTGRSTPTSSGTCGCSPAARFSVSAA